MKKKFFIVVKGPAIFLLSMSLMQALKMKTDIQNIDHPYHPDNEKVLETGIGLFHNIGNDLSYDTLFKTFSLAWENPRDIFVTNPLAWVRYLNMYAANNYAFQNTKKSVLETFNTTVAAILSESENITDVNKRDTFVQNVISNLEHVIQNGTDDKAKLIVSLEKHGKEEDDRWWFPIADFFLFLSDHERVKQLHNSAKPATDSMYNLAISGDLNVTKFLGLLAINQSNALQQTIQQINDSNFSTILSMHQKEHDSLNYPFPTIMSTEPISLLPLYDKFTQHLLTYLHNDTKTAVSKKYKTLREYTPNMQQIYEYVGSMQIKQMTTYEKAGVKTQQIITDNIQKGGKEYFWQVVEAASNYKGLGITALLGGTAVVGAAPAAAIGAGAGLTITAFIKAFVGKAILDTTLDIMKNICKDMYKTTEITAAAVQVIFEKGVNLWYENNPTTSNAFLNVAQKKEFVKIMGRIGLHVYYHNERLGLEMTSIDKFFQSLGKKIMSKTIVEDLNELMIAGIFSIDINDKTNDIKTNTMDDTLNKALYLNFLYRPNFMIGYIAKDVYDTSSYVLKGSYSILSINLMYNLLAALTNLCLYYSNINIPVNSPRRQIIFHKETKKTSTDNIQKNLLVLLQFLYPIIDCDEYWPVRVSKEINNNFNDVKSKNAFNVLLIICSMLFNLNRKKAQPESFKDKKDALSIDLEQVYSHSSNADEIDIKHDKFNLFNLPRKSNFERDITIGILQGDTLTSILKDTDIMTSKNGSNRFPHMSDDENGDIRIMTENIYRSNLPIGQSNSLTSTNTQYGRQLIFYHKIRKISNPVKKEFQLKSGKKHEYYYLSGVYNTTQKVVWSFIEGKWYQYDSNDLVQKIERDPTLFQSGDQCFLLYIAKYSVFGEMTGILQPSSSKKLLKPKTEDIFQEYVTHMYRIVIDKIGTSNFYITYKGDGHPFNHVNLCTVTAYVITSEMQNIGKNPISQDNLVEKILKLKKKIATHFLKLEKDVFNKLDSPKGKLKAYDCIDPNQVFAERLYCTDQLLIMQTIADLENVTIILYAPNFCNNQLTLNPQKTRLSSQTTISMGYVGPTLMWSNSHFFPIVDSNITEYFGNSKGQFMNSEKIMNTFNLHEIEEIADDENEIRVDYKFHFFSNPIPTPNTRFIITNNPGRERELAKSWKEIIKSAWNTETESSATIYDAETHQKM